METIKITQPIDLEYVAEQANENGNWVLYISACGEMSIHRPGGCSEDMPEAVLVYDVGQMHTEMFDPAVQWDEDAVRQYIENCAKDEGYQIEW